MNLDEVPPVIDVHPPHEPIHGWRDFFLHLTTITIGLLIALSLEGLVEWQHHRHLVHDAEASLYAEIKGNAKDLQSNIDDLHKQQAELKHSVVLLKDVIYKRKTAKHKSMTVSFHLVSFEGVTWKTAQETGALAYMPYNRAQEYSDIYSTQDELAAAEQQAARDAILSFGSFLNISGDDPDITPPQATVLEDKIEVLQGQLYLVDIQMKELSVQYKKFLDAHPTA